MESKGKRPGFFFLLLLLKELVAGKVSAKVDPNLTLGTEKDKKPFECENSLVTFEVVNVIVL